MALKRVCAGMLSYSEPRAEIQTSALRDHEPDTDSHHAEETDETDRIHQYRPACCRVCMSVRYGTRVTSICEIKRSGRKEHEHADQDQHTLHAFTLCVKHRDRITRKHAAQVGWQLSTFNSLSARLRPHNVCSGRSTSSVAWSFTHPPTDRRGLE